MSLHFWHLWTIGQKRVKGSYRFLKDGVLIKLLGKTSTDCSFLLHVWLLSLKGRPLMIWGGQGGRKSRKQKFGGASPGKNNFRWPLSKKSIFTEGVLEEKNHFEIFFINGRTLNELDQWDLLLEWYKEQICRWKGHPTFDTEDIIDAHHEKTDLKVFVIVIPKEGLARWAPPILSYPKKDWPAGPRQSFFGYDTD